MTDPDAVAVYGPQAPQRSGVATYIDAMAEHCPPGFRIQRVCNNSWMDPRAAKAVLYHVGASALHHCVFEGLRRRPGPTIVHENNTLSYYYESWDWLKPSVRARVLSMASRRLGRHVGCLEVLQEALDGLPDEDRYCADIGIEQMYLPYLTHALVHSRRLQRRRGRGQIPCRHCARARARRYSGGEAVRGGHARRVGVAAGAPRRAANAARIGACRASAADGALVGDGRTVSTARRGDHPR